MLVLAGCHHVTGAGWFVDQTTGQKVHFSVNVKCDQEAQEARGHLEYKDLAREVRLHGVVAEGAACGGPSGAVAEGTYTPQPKKLGPGGDFFVAWEDTDGDGTLEAGENVFIVLDGGVYDGYSNEGVLGGGHLTNHGHD